MPRGVAPHLAQGGGRLGARARACSLRRIAFTCQRTVSGDRYSRSAISAVVSPAAIMLQDLELARGQALAVREPSRPGASGAATSRTSRTRCAGHLPRERRLAVASTPFSARTSRSGAWSLVR